MRKGRRPRTVWPGDDTHAIAIKVPPLHIREVGGRVQLGLEGFSYVEGATLQEAAAELVEQLLRIAETIRASGTGSLCAECCLDTAVVGFLWELGELAARGEDPRDLLFGPNPPAA